MRSGALSALVALGLCGSTVAGIAQQATPADLVDALNGLFGKHAGDRAAHTKGICLTEASSPRRRRRSCQRPRTSPKRCPFAPASRLAAATRMRPTTLRTMCVGSLSSLISATARAPISSPSRRPCSL